MAKKDPSKMTLFERHPELEKQHNELVSLLKQRGLLGKVDFS